MKVLFGRSRGAARTRSARCVTVSGRLPGLLAAFLGILVLVTCSNTALAQTAFYSAPTSAFADLPNGALIRSQPIDGAPDGAAAYRVLYRSEGLHGEPIAVLRRGNRSFGSNAAERPARLWRGRTRRRALSASALPPSHVCFSNRSRVCTGCCSKASWLLRPIILALALRGRILIWLESAKAVPSWIPYASRD